MVQGSQCKQQKRRPPVEAAALYALQ